MNFSLVVFYEHGSECHSFWFNVFFNLINRFFSTTISSFEKLREKIDDNQWFLVSARRLYNEQKTHISERKCFKKRQKLLMDTLKSFFNCATFRSLLHHLWTDCSNNNFCICRFKRILSICSGLMLVLHWFIINPALENWRSTPAGIKGIAWIPLATYDNNVNFSE
jgi:hypothetical protein